MDETSLDDAALLALMAIGHTAALSALYDRYRRLVYSLARGVVGDAATADEITLEVFTRVWRQAGSYRAEKAKVTTWMTAITRHLAIDALRRRNARPEVSEAEWSEPTPPAAPERQTEERVELALQRGRVRAAVAQLPPEQRQALALAFFQGLTHPEIAAALQQPLGTVKTRIRLAMHKLRQALSEDAPAADQSDRAGAAYGSEAARRTTGEQ